MIGHLGARLQLEKYLPPAVLINGPYSVGKRTLAHHLADYHRAGFGDVLDIERLSMVEARGLTTHFSRRPAGKVRIGIIGLDEATERSQNAILKLIEEPPADCHLLLLSTTVSSVLLTVLSRCFRTHLGLLQLEEVAEILTTTQGWDPAKAYEAAALSGGTIAGALQLDEERRTRERVLPILSAMVTSDSILASNATEILWDAQEGPLVLRALQRWTMEARTGQWRYFSSEDGAEVISRGSVDAISGALSSGARPVIAVRAAIVAAGRGRVSR